MPVPASRPGVEPTIGHNIVDYGREVTERLTADYGELINGVSALLDEARTMPARIDTDDEASLVAGHIKKMRDTVSRIEAFHESEKAPYLRGGQAVDQVFFGLWEKLVRRNTKSGKAGAADILQARINDFLQRKLDAERKRLAEEQQRAAEEASRKRQEEERLRLEAEERERAAARARKPENIAAHEAAAELAETKADNLHLSARVDEQAAAAATQQLAGKSADLVRTRTDSGAILTMRKVNYARVVDASKIPLEALRPYLKPSAIEDAVKAWGRATEYKGTMPGVEVGSTDEGAVL